MIFQNLPLLLILLIPFILFAILTLTNKEGVERVFDKKTLERIKVEGSGLSNKVRNVIFFVAILFMIVAIGHPVIIKGEKEIKLSGLNAIIAIDISGSMRSTDRYPNRLAFAKEKVKTLLDSLGSDEIMLIAFSENIYLISPMTSDKETLKEVVSGIDKNYLQGATNWTALANVLKKSLKDKNPKIAIVVSDGGESRDLKEFDKIIMDEKIKLYSILIGTKDGALILDKDSKAILKNDQIVKSYLNTELGSIAKKSGGDFVIADYSSSNIEELAKKIDSNLAITNQKKSIKVQDKVELFYYPLILSVILLIIAFSSLPDSEENIKREQ